MRKDSGHIKVMIAGIGGASLGTEIYKSLNLAGGYQIYGCDISSTAYGLYEEGFAKTYLVERDDYVDNVLTACRDAGATFLIPGGEQPMTLLTAASDEFAASGIQLLANAPPLVSLFSDKSSTFSLLEECHIQIPRTRAINSVADVNFVGLPCIVKPATGSGGSAGVFFAVTSEEALLYAEFIGRTGAVAVAQEYIDADEEEYTVGVLSLPDKHVVGSVALRRALDAKLSISYRGRGGVVSSGYSQGHVAEYPELCRQAEAVAAAVESRGPINIQGRLRNGILLPFEINPRFSASTYLRSMAGFNEVDMLIKYFVSGKRPRRPLIRAGWYLRSLCEQFVPEAALK